MKSSRINFEFPEDIKQQIKHEAIRKRTTIHEIGVRCFNKWISKNKKSKELIWLE